MVKNLPSNAGESVSVPDWGTKIPHASEQLRLRHRNESEAHVRNKDLNAAIKTKPKPKHQIAHPSSSIG